jgi:hypothetical protein
MNILAATSLATCLLECSHCAGRRFRLVEQWQVFQLSLSLKCLLNLVVNNNRFICGHRNRRAYNAASERGGNQWKFAVIAHDSVSLSCYSIQVSAC